MSPALQGQVDVAELGQILQWRSAIGLNILNFVPMEAQHAVPLRSRLGKQRCKVLFYQPQPQAEALLCTVQKLDKEHLFWDNRVHETDNWRHP